MCVAFLVCKRVRWREPAVTNLSLTVTYILFKGIRGSRPSTYRVRNSRQKRSIRRPIARKETRKQKTGCETVESSTARETTKKPENQECGGQSALVGSSASCIHTQPSSSIAQQLAPVYFPSPWPLHANPNKFKPSHMYTHNRVPSWG